MGFFFKSCLNILDSSSLDSSSEGSLARLHAMESERRRRLRHANNTPSPLHIRRPRMNVHRNNLASHQQLVADYFPEVPAFNATMFRRRFRMRRELFLRIKDGVESHEPYFQQRQNDAGRLGLSSLTKVSVALRILSYGVSTDLLDEYFRIGESTSVMCLKIFVKTIVEVFDERYLRSPNSKDIARLLDIGECRGFRGMLGSIDCMHWEWKNCPYAWHDMYTSRHHVPAIILECVASYDLWIWHEFFGLPGSLNDINVLERSSLFTELANGRAPEANYSINGNNYTMGYYLANGIYPKWVTFVKTIPIQANRKEAHFVRREEACRKDIERAFGVLQARFAIVAGPVRHFKQKVLQNIMIACIIMHNMILEDERDLDLNTDPHTAYEPHYASPLPPDTARNREADMAAFIQRHCDIRDRSAHARLQCDMIDHLWDIHSESL